ncbi:MAG: GDYXXLXY domain-containing protein [Bdellovibrionaceae bacterium]|nr:GDYXXLXY domain-containing protein [Bdellovibrionales bacterium]MCB9254311.1 GDYXXLXY domain-containing protein [Pseudobdellovibrionaceae bacterium]
MRTLFAIFFPILVMGIWIGQQTYHHTYGDLVELPVKGYDPGDLQIGHYLKFNVDYGKYPICNKRSPSRKWRMCVCLDIVGPDRKAIASWSGDCAARPPWGCGLWLRGYCFYDHFVANIERYYVPEEYARALTVIPPGASIRARLNQNGTGVVTEFLVKGEPITEFAKRNQAAIRNTPEREPAESDAQDLPKNGEVETTPQAENPSP